MLNKVHLPPTNSTEPLCMLMLPLVRVSDVYGNYSYSSFK